jgi:hypothetical protein
MRLWLRAGVVARPLNFTVRVRNKIRLCSEIDKTEEPRPRPFAGSRGEARTAATCRGLEPTLAPRLRLSPVCLRLIPGRAPRLCCSSQLMISAPAQGTRGPWLIARGRA